jgi:hypothetical protein
MPTALLADRFLTVLLHSDHLCDPQDLGDSDECVESDDCDERDDPDSQNGRDDATERTSQWLHDLGSVPTKSRLSEVAATPWPPLSPPLTTDIVDMEPPELEGAITPNANGAAEAGCANTTRTAEAGNDGPSSKRQKTTGSRRSSVASASQAANRGEVRKERPFKLEPMIAGRTPLKLQELVMAMRSCVRVDGVVDESLKVRTLMPSPVSYTVKSLTMGLSAQLTEGKSPITAQERAIHMFLSDLAPHCFKNTSQENATLEAGGQNTSATLLSDAEDHRGHCHMPG